MKYQFCIRFANIDANSAASKAVMDCNRIFTASGYKDYTITVGDNTNKSTYYPYLLHELFKFYRAIKRNSIIAVQYPLLSINGVFKLFIHIARFKNAKCYCIVHDLESLRRGGTQPDLIAAEVKNLNAYDHLIVHNNVMRQWLQNAGVTKTMIPLTLFDYLCDNFSVSEHREIPTIVYAGNLAKSVFIYSLAQIRSVKFHVYGPGYNGENISNGPHNVTWKGQYHPDEIPEKLIGGYGLIWDGEHIDHCDEVLGNYLKYNNPHKFSLYIAAGLPVIAPRDSAIGKLIALWDIGFLIDSLYNLEQIAFNVDRYHTQIRNVMEIRERVISGDFFREAIKQSEKGLE